VPTPGDELTDLDATALSGLLRSGDLTRGELLDAVVARMEALDGRLGAVPIRCVDRARSRLHEASDISLDRPFGGVPTFVKDLVDLEGVPRTDGSRSMQTNISTASPPYVEALERTGLIVTGKTNTPEFASLPVTDNEVYGPTSNPWDLSRSTGGSSGGTAAAVAARYTPIAHGTDGGGSNRIPASWCGVLGMKASRGRLASGELDGSHPTLKTHQALSRTVRDSAALFLATQNDVDNPYPKLDGLPDLGDRRLRVALTLDDPFGTPPEPVVGDAIEATAALCEQLGHHVEPAPQPVDGEEFFAMYTGLFLSRTVGLIEMLEQAAGMPIEESRLLTPATIGMVRRGDDLPPDTAEQADVTRRQINADLDRFFSGVDVWLTPVTWCTALNHGDISPAGGFDPEHSQRLLSHLAMANTWGGPAMSVPLGWPDDGLPVGSHFSAAPGGDDLLYALAFQLEAAQPWAHHRPALIG